MEIPKDLTWRITKYDNRTDDLLLSDQDKLKNRVAAKENPGNYFIDYQIRMPLF